MLNNIFLRFSEFAILGKGKHPFSDKYGATTEAILTDFLSTETIVNASINELVTFITSKSRDRIANPEQTTYLLLKVTQDSYRLDRCLYEPLTISIGCSFNCINAFEKELKAIDDAILRTVKRLNPMEYQILNSISGIGKVYASDILTKLGIIKCFKNNNALTKYAGIVWKENQSGTFEAEDTPLDKAGNHYLLYYIIEAAGSVVAHCPEYKVFYDKKYSEVRTHQHKRALALTSHNIDTYAFGTARQRSTLLYGKE